jgi:hypothetical protein
MVIRNLTKTNPQGTLVNDSPVDGHRALEVGDVISINGRKFRFEAAKKQEAAEEVAEPEGSAQKAKRPKTPKAGPNAAGAAQDENAGQKPIAGSVNALASPSVRSALIARRAAISGEAHDSSPEASPHPATKQPTSRKKSPKPARLPSAATAATILLDATKSSTTKPRAAAAAPVDRGSLMAQLQERMAASRVASPVAAKPPTTLCPTPAAVKSPTPLGLDPPAELIAEPASEGKKVNPKARTPRSDTPKPATGKRATPKPATPKPTAVATPKPKATPEPKSIVSATPSPVAPTTASVDAIVECIFAPTSSAARATPQRDEQTHATLCAMIQKRWTPASVRKIESKTPAASRTPLPEPTVAATPTQPANAFQQPTPLAAPGEPGSVCREMLPPRTVGKPPPMEEFGSARKPSSAAHKTATPTARKPATPVAHKPATPMSVAEAPQPDGAEPMEVDGAASCAMAVKKPRSSLRGSVGRKGLRVSFGSGQLEPGAADISPRLLPTPSKVKLSPAAHNSPAATGAHSAEVSARMSVVAADASPLVHQPGARRVSTGGAGAEPRRRSVKFQRTSQDSLRLSSADELVQADGPASERKRKPVRQSWDQTPGRKVERRASKTPAAQKCRAQPTPATNAAAINAPATADSATAKSTGGLAGVRSAIWSHFTPNAASVVTGLLEGEFTPLYAVDGSDGNAELGVSPGTMHAFGLFRMGAPGLTPSSRCPSEHTSVCGSAASMSAGGPEGSDAASTPGAGTPSYAKPMLVPPFEPTPPGAACHKSPKPMGGRVNSHVRFVDGMPVAASDTWAGVMRYEVTGPAGALVAEPVEMSFWATWDEVQLWGDEDWAEAEAEEWQSDDDEQDEEGDVPAVSPGAHLRPVGAHIRFSDAVTSPTTPHAPPSPSAPASAARSAGSALPASRSTARQSLEAADAAPPAAAPSRRESIAESEGTIYGWEQVLDDEEELDEAAEELDEAAEELDEAAEELDEAAEELDEAAEEPAAENAAPADCLLGEAAVDVFGVSGVLSSTRGATPFAHRGLGRNTVATADELAQAGSPAAPGSDKSVHSVHAHSVLEDSSTPVGEEAAPACRLSFAAGELSAASAGPSPAPSSRRSRRSSLSSTIATPAPAREPPPAPAPTPVSALGSPRRASARHSTASSGHRSDPKGGAQALQAHHITGMFSPAPVHNVPIASSQPQRARRFSLKRPSNAAMAPSVQSAYSVVMPSPGSARLGHPVAQWPPKAELRRASLCASEASECSLYDETSEDEDDWTDCTTDAEEAAVETSEETSEESAVEAAVVAGVEAGPTDMATEACMQAEAAAGHLSPALGVFSGQIPEPSSVSRHMLRAAAMPSVPPLEEFGSARKAPPRSPMADEVAPPYAAAEPLVEPPVASQRPVLESAEAKLATPTAAPEMPHVGAPTAASIEEELPAQDDDDAPTTGCQDEAAAAEPHCEGGLSRAALESLKVIELRAMLETRGLSPAGRKAELVQRLLDVAVDAATTLSTAALAQLSAMKVAELRALLSDAGLEAAGKKPELLARAAEAAATGKVVIAEAQSGESSGQAPSSDEEKEPPPSAGGEDRPGKRVRFGAQNVECAITPASSLRKAKRSKAEEAPSSADSNGSARRRSMRGRQ